MEDLVLQVMAIYDRLPAANQEELKARLLERWGIEAHPVPGPAHGCPSCGGIFDGPHACPGYPSTEYDVVLTGCQALSLIPTMRVIRELVPKSFTLKDVHDLVRSPPRTVVTGVSLREAEEVLAGLKAAGAVASINTTREKR